MCLLQTILCSVVMATHKQSGPLYSGKTSYTLAYRMFFFLCVFFFLLFSLPLSQTFKINLI